mmetsp:Transcript_12023/g.35567  ORF Transcript_12023/g.35567 Transcript_12023/m.35567 type:complete len:610 (-) Transcript_12023:1065-2894(-)
MLRTPATSTNPTLSALARSAGLGEELRLERLCEQGYVRRLLRLDDDAAHALAWPQPDLGQHDDTVECLDRKVEHVRASVQLAPRDEKHVGRLELWAQRVDILVGGADALHVERRLLSDALPLLEEGAALDAPVGGEEGEDIALVLEVEDLHVVLDRHLHVALRVLRLARRGERHQPRVRLARRELRRHHLAERPWRLRHQPKRVFVVLDGEAGQGRGRVILDGDLLEDAPVLRDEGAADLHALAAVRGEHHLGGRGGGRGRRRSPEEVCHAWRRQARGAAHAAAAGRRRGDLVVEAQQVGEPAGGGGGHRGRRRLRTAHPSVHHVGGDVGVALLVLVVVRPAAERGHHAGAAGDECGGRLVVDGGEGGEVRDELVEHGRVEREGVVVDVWLLGEHDLLGGLGVGREQAPVDVAAVAQVGVVRVLRREREHVLHHLLRLRRPLEEELDRGGEHLQLDGGGLIVERLEEGLEQLVRVVDPLRVLADDPDHRPLRLGLVERVEVLAERADDGLVPVGELAEDVLDDDDRLLHHVVDLRLDELEQHVDAALGGALELDRAPPDGAHGPAHELDVHLGGVLLELHEHLVDVPLRGELDHDLELLHLDVDRVVVL